MSHSKQLHVVAVITCSLTLIAMSGELTSAAIRAPFSVSSCSSLGPDLHVRRIDHVCSSSGAQRPQIHVTSRLRIVTKSLPDAISGQPYLAQLKSVGGVKPYRCTMKSPSVVPPGMKLVSNSTTSICEIRGVGPLLDVGRMTYIFERFTIVVSDSSKPRRSLKQVTLTLATNVPPVVSSTSTVIAGLNQPSETATSRSGDLYFTSAVSAQAVVIDSLAPDSSIPVVVYRLVGPQPQIYDIHFDPTGNLIFIQSDLTGSDGSSRRWDLVRVSPSTGVTTVLVTTTGMTSASIAPFNCAGWSDCGLLSGTQVDLASVDGAGIIYFSEHSIDASSGHQVADLLALAPGNSSPRVIEHFAGISGSDLIYALTAAKNGDVYFIENSALYQWRALGLRVLVPSSEGPINSGLDVAGNLNVLEKAFTGYVKFGCATSTTFGVVTFSASDLAGPNPAPVTISTGTYPGFVAPWVGTSSFFRVSAAGDSYWLQTRIDCTTSAFLTNNVVGSSRGHQQQMVLFDETIPSSYPSDYTAEAQCPLALATFGESVYFTSLQAGDLFRLGP